MKIDKSKIEYIANLSRINIDQDKIEYFADQLNMILDYMDKLNAVDVSSVEPTSHVIKVENVFREDEVKPSLAQDQVLANAPEKEDGFFKVPKIIG